MMIQYVLVFAGTGPSLGITDQTRCIIESYQSPQNSSSYHPRGLDFYTACPFEVIQIPRLDLLRADTNRLLAVWHYAANQLECNIRSHYLLWG